MLPQISLQAKVFKEDYTVVTLKIFCFSIVTVCNTRHDSLEKNERQFLTLVHFHTRSSISHFSISHDNREATHETNDHYKHFFYREHLFCAGI